MTVDVRPWLPADTRPPPALQALLADVVAGWSARWFAGEAMALGTLARDGAGAFGWRALDAGLMLGAVPDAALTVGARMLDVTPGDRAPRDVALLEEVAEDCLADLRARLAQLVEARGGGEWRPIVRASGWSAAIGGPRGPLALALSNALFATLVARVLPAADPVALGSGAEALAAVDVRVSAAVGRADLSVADLRALETGDVVVLDRSLADPVPIAVDGHPLPRGTVRVVPAEPQPHLEIVQAVK